MIKFKETVKESQNKLVAKMLDQFAYKDQVLFESDLQLLFSCFNLIKTLESFERHTKIEKVIYILTNREAYNCQAIAAELLAIIENYAETQKLNFYDDTYGAINYKEFSIYHKTRKFIN